MASIFSVIKKKASQVYDQLNPFDNGLTATQRTPTSNQSFAQQAAHVGSSVVHTVADPLVQFPLDVGTLGYNKLVAPTFHLPQQNIQQNPYLGSTAREVGATGTAKQAVGSGIQTGLTIGTGGIDRLAESAASKILPKTIPSIIARVAPKLATGAVVGGGFNVGSGISAGHTAKQVVTHDLPVGAALGAGLPLAGEFARVGGKAATDAFANRTPLDQSGKITAVEGGSSVPTVKNVIRTAKEKTLKTRGFQNNIENTGLPQTNETADAVAKSIPGYKPITNKATLTRAASKISENPQNAIASLLTKPQLTSAEDVAMGNLLLRDFIEKGDVASAIEVGNKLGIDGTKLGQAIQAYSTFKRTTPEGVITYASKKALKAGKELTPEQGQQLVDQAKAIAAMPEGLDKAKATQQLLGNADKVGRTWRDAVSEALSVPKALMATADLSAPLRQGAILGSRYPKEFAQAAAQSVKYMFNPKAYEQSMYDITQRPSYDLMRSTKLAVDGAQQLTGAEEQFMNNLLETDTAKKLGIGHIVGGSDRAYTGFLTKLRADVFDKVISQSQDAGVQLDKDALDSLSRFINTASGRGSLGKLGSVDLERSAGLLSKALFSPRLWKSRLDTLNPVYYAKLDPVARKLALQSAASFAGVATTVLGLASAAGATVNWDPRSADFAKIKVGNTRYDILGGLQQNIRLAAQLITGEKINSSTGQLQTLGAKRGFGKPSRLDLLLQFGESKSAPLVGYGAKVLQGTDPGGNPINPATEAAKLFIPLNAQDIYSAAKDKKSLAKGAATAVPGVFGIGVQTYTAGKSDKQAAKNQTAYDAAGLNSPAAQKFLGMSAKDQRKAALTDPQAKQFYTLKQTADVHSRPDLVLPTGLDQTSSDVLNKFNRLTGPEKQQLYASDPSAKYHYDEASYQRDKALGNYTKAEQAIKEKSLEKESVGSNYSQDTRDLYGMSLSSLADYLSTNPDQQTVNDLVDYDKALQDAGVISKSKFAKYAPGQTPPASGSGTTKKISVNGGSSVARAKAAPSPTIKVTSAKTGKSGKVAVKARSHGTSGKGTLKIKRG